VTHTSEINVEGSVEIGTGLKIVERITTAEVVDGLRQRQTLYHELVSTEAIATFSDQGLTQGYVVFGQPGAGKTYFIRKILRQLLRINEEDEKTRYGGLIIDPKGDYPQVISAEISRSLHRKNPIIIYPEMKKPINILHCGLSPENLARIIAASCKALAPAADDYFHNNLAVVLSAILVSNDILERKIGGKALSMRDLLHFLSGYEGTKGARKRKLLSHIEMLEGYAEPKGVPPVSERFRPGRARHHAASPAGIDLELTEKEQRKLARCATNLRAFLAEEKSYVAEQLFKQAFEELQELDFLLKPMKINEPNFYDDIINSGRIVTVSIPPSETYARSVFTLIKNIFQKVVLDRFARFAAEEGAYAAISNNVRPVFLICDEYHLSASDSPERGVGDSTFLSLCRAFGCFSLFATQGLEQLKTSPIADRWEAVIGLFRAKIFFTVGDNSTATLASDIAGEQQSVFVATSLNESSQGKSFGMSDQLTTQQQLPKYIVLRCLGRGQAAIIGSLDGVSSPGVQVVNI
jgi:hypothetical protein